MKLKTPSTFPTRPILKPFKFPDGFVLIQDTSEQKPLFTPQTTPVDLIIINKKLKDGDYSIKGFEPYFTIERKQMSDFYRYIGAEREKTYRKLKRFKTMIDKDGWVGLVIECSEADILFGNLYSKVSPETARQALVSFEVRTGIHCYYSRSRNEIRRWVLDRMIKFYRLKREV